MLFPMYKPGEICPETAIYEMLDEHLQSVNYPRKVQLGKRFPPSPAKGYSYWGDPLI